MTPKKSVKRKLEGQKSMLDFMSTPKKQKTNVVDLESLDKNIPETPSTPKSLQQNMRQNPSTPKSQCKGKDPSTPNTPGSRKFKSEWKKLFPFLRYDSNRRLLFCTVCEVAKRNNTFTEGCDQLKTDAIQKHTITKDHKFALSAKEASGSIQEAAVKIADTEKDAIIGIMKNLYYLAQHNDPSSAITDLNKLLINHHISQFEPLVKSDNSLPYEHHESVREMQEAMSEVVMEELLQDINDSGIYSLMADESTDVSTQKKTFVLYVRYAKDGLSKTKFLEVTELNGDECNAINICDTIIRVLSAKGLNIHDMCCITTDGASVMTGVRGGVTTLMKQRNVNLLRIHCIAHRLELASGQAADRVTYLKKYQAMINTIFKYYHYSPKHQSKLNKIQSVFEMSQKKFKQTFHTRWLSFDGAVDSDVENYDALLACLEMDVAEEDDPTAKGILTFVSTYQFLATVKTP